MSNVASSILTVQRDFGVCRLLTTAVLAVVLGGGVSAQSADGVQFVDDLEQSLRGRMATTQPATQNYSARGARSTASPARRPYPTPAAQQQAREGSSWRSKFRFKNPLSGLFPGKDDDVRITAGSSMPQSRQGSSIVPAGPNRNAMAGGIDRSANRSNALATRATSTHQPKGLFQLGPREAPAAGEISSDRLTPPLPREQVAQASQGMPRPISGNDGRSAAMAANLAHGNPTGMPLAIGQPRRSGFGDDLEVAVVSDRDDRPQSQPVASHESPEDADRSTPSGPLPEVVGPDGGRLLTDGTQTAGVPRSITHNANLPQPPVPPISGPQPQLVAGGPALSANRTAANWQPAGAASHVRQASALRNPTSRPTAEHDPATAAVIPPQPYAPPAEVRENPVTRIPAQPTEKAVQLLTQANQLSTTAVTEDEYTQVIQLCRHVLAIDDSQMAVEYSRDLAGWALNRRGEQKADEGRDKEALLDFEDALRLDPNRWRAVHNRGVIAAQSGRFADAFDDFNRTIELNPKFAKAYSNRGTLYVQAGKLKEAMDDYRQAIVHDPDLAVAHKGRARACHMLGDFDSAIQHYDAATLLAPDDARIVNNRGDLLVDMGRYNAAADNYQQAIDLDGNLATAYRNLAWLQATCPDKQCQDHEAALKNANRALQLTPKPTDLEYDTLAAAHAASGDFESAISLMEKAISLAKDDDVPNYQWRQKLYRRGQPYVTEPASTIQQASYAD